MDRLFGALIRSLALLLPIIRIVSGHSSAVVSIVALCSSPSVVEVSECR